MGITDDRASELSEAEIERGRLLFARGVEFRQGVARIDDLPPCEGAEVAFAGRSNVGKSSLINALSGRKALARTSNTPGRTRELNFFTLGDDLHLVDMPGYGYAKVAKMEVAAWTRLIGQYLAGRACLAQLFLLVDARHGLKPSDTELMDQLDTTAVSYQIVVTKADKPGAAELERIVAGIEKAITKRPASYPVIAVTSARSGSGIDRLRAHIAALSGPAANRL